MSIQALSFRVLSVVASLPFVMVLTGAVSADIPMPSSQTDEISVSDARDHLFYLASPALEGRLTGSAGERLAGEYIIKVFQQAGVEPAGERGEFWQEFDFTAGVRLGESNSFAVAGSAPLVLNQDFRPLSFSQNAEAVGAGVVFAGYGIQAPAAQGFPEYNSFANLDVTGKWVLVFRFLPEGIQPAHRQHLYPYSDLKRKAVALRGLGAKGMIVVSGPNSHAKDPLVPLTFDAAMSGISIMAVSVTDAVGEALVASTGKTLALLQDELDGGAALPGVPLTGVTVDARVDIIQEHQKGHNVVGRIRCGAPESAPLVVIGAHYDHLGLVEPGNPSAGIRVGADDNGSGTVGMLEIAQDLGRRCSRGALTLRKDILVAAWSGEELGMLGSSHFANTSAGGPSGTLYPRVAAYLNMDMIGRLNGTLVLQGAGSSSLWKPLAERLAGEAGIAVSIQEDPYLPTDSTAFYLKGVPTLNAFTGAHDDYHTPADTPDKINYEGLRAVTTLMRDAALAVALTEDVPDFKLVPRPPSGTGFRVYLGTVPDMSQTDIKGVLLAGVRVKSPADRAGLKAGDIIVELAGSKIENIYDYSFALTALRVGEQVPIAVLRGAERLVFPIVPEPRQ